MQFVNSWKYIQKLFGQKLDRSYAVLTSYQSLHVLSMNFPLSQFRVATHQKVKNSLTFHWSLKSFHWPFINEKQSMFTFTLAFLLAINIFLFIFNLSRLLWKEEGIWKKAFTMKTTDHSVRHWVSNWLLCSTLFIFSEKKCISKSWRKLMNYKPENSIPLLFTDFDNIEDFPWPWKIFVFPWPWRPCNCSLGAQNEPWLPNSCLGWYMKSYFSFFFSCVCRCTMLEYSLEHHLILLTLGGSGPYFMPGSINAKTEHTQLGSSALLCNKAIFKKFLHAF